jgi:hypothetical protein
VCFIGREVGIEWSWDMRYELYATEDMKNYELMDETVTFRAYDMGCFLSDTTGLLLDLLHVFILPRINAEVFVSEEGDMNVVVIPYFVLKPKECLICYKLS